MPECFYIKAASNRAIFLLKAVKIIAKKRKRNNALPKSDEEFAEERVNGLEKVALKAMKRQHNK